MSFFSGVLFDFSFSDEVIVESAQQASDFFHIDEPMLIAEDFTTGVYINADTSAADDILVFSRDQLLGMGVTERDGLDLVMTHEAAHRALQGLDCGFNAHEEELCCDFMSGVRAGLNSIDVTQMKESIIGTLPSESHPGGFDRIEAIDAGIDFATKYLSQHGYAPSFNECLDYFQNDAEAMGSYNWDEYLDTTNLNQDNIFLNGYTQFENNPHILEDEHEIKYWESDMEHRVSKGESETIIDESCESEECQSYVTSPNFKGLVDDKDWHEKKAKENLEWANWHRSQADKAADRGDHASAKDHIATANSYDAKAKDHMKSARICAK